MPADVSITLGTFAGRRCASSGSPWEPVVGYSRAVRSGDLIAVSGTVGLNPDRSYPSGAAAQTRRALEIVQAAIEALGGTLAHVIRTRIFVVDIAQADVIGAVHGEFFRDVRPACTMVQVARLINDAALVEIEADAVVS